MKGIAMERWLVGGQAKEMNVLSGDKPWRNLLLRHEGDSAWRDGLSGTSHGDGIVGMMVRLRSPH
jgi:hypothetical protein